MKKVLSFAMLVLSLCFVGCFSQTKEDSEEKGEKLTRAVAPFTVDNAVTVFYKKTKWTTLSNIHYTVNNSKWYDSCMNTDYNNGVLTGFEKITLRASYLKFCFNSNGVWDYNNYTITSPGTYKIENGVLSKMGTCNVNITISGVPTYIGYQTLRIYKDSVLIQKVETTTDYQWRAVATVNNLPVGGNYRFVVSNWGNFMDYSVNISQNITISDIGKTLELTGNIVETISPFSSSPNYFPAGRGNDVEIFYSNPNYTANPTAAYQRANNTMYIAYDNGTAWKEQVMDNSSSQAMWRIGEDGYNVARAYLSFNRVPWTKISFYIKDSNNVRDNNNSANYQITQPGKYLLINGYLLKI